MPASIPAYQLACNGASDTTRPAEAIESFAGVGCFFPLAKLATDETVLDLGSGSGMDSFVAALAVASQPSKDNPQYRFISDRALGAAASKYSVRRVCVLAVEA